MHSLEEVGQEADTVRSEIEQIYVRGLAASSASDRKKLSALAEEWNRIGAGHVASKLADALRAADAGAKEAPRALLSAHTSLHVFERVLSLEAAAQAWTAHLEALRGEAGEGSADTTPAAEKTDPKEAEKADKKAAAAPPVEDPKGALTLLDELARAVEDLVRTGLSSATESTRAKLDASFKEASRRKLLRLGASLRFVNEEVGRFLADDGSFSIRRFSFFLHRSWLLSRGLAKGIRDKDDRLLASLLLAGGGAPRPVKWLDVVTMGVLQRTAQSACTFDFKLRVVDSSEADLAGRSLTYSLVFASKKGVPAGAYLQLPQPQKFIPKIFREGKVVRVEGAAVMLDDRGAGRLMLGPPSTAKEGAVFARWDSFLSFDAAAALGRVRRCSPGPLDLAVELQEEVLVQNATLADKPLRTEPERRFYLLSTPQNLSFDVVIPEGPDGEELYPRLKAALKPAKKPALYGLAYYEFGRTLLLPLSVFKKDGPELFTLSEKKFDLSALLGTLNIGR